MSTELDIYKRNRILEIKKICSDKISRLQYILKNNINLLSRTALRNKQSIINSLITKYNNDSYILINSLNVEIKKINSYTPPFNVVKPNNKKALLVGINYIGTPYELSGCINDTSRMKVLLTNFGFNSFKILNDSNEEKATKELILNEFKNLLINANSGDVLFFYFSGHGSYTYDVSNDEPDGNDEMIISSDLCAIFDDELKQLLSIYIKKDVTVIGLFDSCHSGTMLDLKYNYLDSNNYDEYTENDKVSECFGNVLMISGCMDSQTSSECFINNTLQGAVTWSFIESINKTPNLTWRELLRSMRSLLKSKYCNQIPQLSTDSFYNIDSKVFI
jgi:hypothetical protein